MSYTPTAWQSGDVISSARLNKIEQGIVDAASSGGGAFVCEYDTSTGRLNKTCGEILAAFNAGQEVVFLYTTTPTIIIDPSIGDDEGGSEQ